MTALVETRCAICGTAGGARELYASTFSEEALRENVFSARRAPDRLHFRIVRCESCGLVRSDPVAPPEVTAALYERSTFDYATEVPSLQKTYGTYLDRMRKHGRVESLLEIGAGNGFFLEEALRRGIRTVRGVEPSVDAVEKASGIVRDRLVNAPMRHGLFGEKEFDSACLFQVLDHLPDPKGVLEEIARVLKPAGLLLILNHDVEAWSAKLLGEASPIIDVEHTYLYGHRTLARLVNDAGFEVVESGRAWNRTSVRYVVHLLPLPGGVKTLLLNVLRVTRVGGVPLVLPFGNLYLIARRRSAA